MSTATLKAPYQVTSITLGTASQAAIVTVLGTGRVALQCPSAVQYNFDLAVTENLDMSAVKGWDVPAAQGYQEDLSMQQGDGTRINIWSLTASAVVKLKITPTK